MAKDKKKSKYTSSYFLGRYTPPGFLLAAFSSIRRILKSKKNIKRILWIAPSVIALVLAVIGCAYFIKERRPQDLEVNYRFNTPDIPESRASEVPSLKIEFFGSVARAEDVGKELEYPIPIDPLIPGTWKWDDDRHLIFTPDEHWPVGTEYKVRFPKELFADHVEVDEGFSFSIDAMQVWIAKSEFYIDPRDGAIKRILATLSSNYPIDPASLDGKITIIPDLKADSGSFRNREYGFTVSHSDDFRETFIVSEPIGIPAEDVNTSILVAKGLRSSWGGKPMKTGVKGRVTVPGASNYVQVLSADHSLVLNENQEYEQVLVLSTQGTITMKELLSHLEVWLLPVDRPEFLGYRESEDHHWGPRDEIGSEVLRLSKLVELDAIPNAAEYADTNSFRLDVPQDRYLYLKFTKGAHFYGDYFLGKDFKTILRVDHYPKEVKILSEGSLLSMSGDKKISILTRGVPSVDYYIGRIRPDDLNHLITQSNGKLSDLQFENYRFGEYNITEQYRERKRVAIADPAKAEYISFDFSRYLHTALESNLRYGLFFFEAGHKDDDYNYYSDARLIMVTDLGVYVKKAADGSRDVFIQSLATGAPAGGILVQVLAVNGNAVASGYTDSEGHAAFPPFDHLKQEDRPVAFVASRGDDMSFLPYIGVGQYLEYSGFEVGGIRGATDPKQLNAFLFSDRGLYRPGDEMRLGAVVKSGDWNIDIEGTPLEFRITDSKGSEILTEERRLSSSGFEEFQYATQEYSPTGAYVASLYLVRKTRNRDEKILLGSTTLKVEEFLPDNLNISASFMPQATDGWISADNLKGIVSVRNLFGTPALGNRVSAQLTLSPGYRRFRGYEDYKFFDPLLKDNEYQEQLGEQETDELGRCEFPIDLSRFEEASYNLRFFVEAFEKGSGRGVSFETSTFVSPLDYLVGYKADGSLRYINKDSARSVEFLALDSSMNPKAVENMILEISEIRYISTLVRQPSGVFKYESVEKPRSISRKSIDLSALGTAVNLPTETPGEFEVELVGPDGRKYNSFKYSVKGAANVERRLDRNAELEIVLDKTDYEHGEAVEIFIKAPYSGAGLITIESDKVYAYKWFQIAGSSTTQTIRVPQDLKGNGYVNICLLRSSNSPEIFMSPLSYGAAPFSVSREKQTNHIELVIPEEAKPGRSFPIRYSTSREGKIVVFAVDEGILQVARYSTPKPLEFFFRKRAMEVSTTQILDLLLPEFSIVQSVTAVGGGGPGEYLERNLNPFRRRRLEPVAYWSGILDSGPEEGLVEYTIPSHFNGTLRVMAVAVSDDAVGGAEQSALIRDTFIIKPSVPLAAAPGDEFEVSVTVANNQKGSGENAAVRLAVDPGPGLSISTEPAVVMDIPEGRDELAVFRVRAGDTLGGTTLQFTASANNETSTYTSSISLRPAMPYRTTVHSGSVRRGKETITMPRVVRDELATNEISLSYLPIALAKGLYFFLVEYPYACTEQVVSSTFPLLYPDLLEEMNLTSDEADSKVRKSIQILQSRIKDDGSVGSWTSRSASYPVIDTYTAMFLRQARKAGFDVSDSLYNACLRRLEAIAESKGSSRYEVIDRAFAIYVLTLNDRVTTPEIERLKKQLNKEHKDWETDFTGLFLAGSYAMLQQDRQASAILGKIKREYRGKEAGIYLNSLAYSALYLRMLAEHFPRRLKDLSNDLLESITDRLEAGVFTTFSSSFTLMGIDSYLNEVPDAEQGNFVVVEYRSDDSDSVLTVTGEKLFSTRFSPSANRLEIENSDNLHLFYQALRAGFDAERPEEAVSHGIEVYRELRDARGNTANSFKLGENAAASVRFRSLDDSTISQVAIVDILPAGFEVDIASVRESVKSGSWKPEYVDIREDRIILFGTVTGRLKEFNYTIRPIARGVFTSPPVYAEAMYDRSTWSIHPAPAVTVE